MNKWINQVEQFWNLPMWIPRLIFWILLIFSLTFRCEVQFYSLLVNSISLSSSPCVSLFVSFSFAHSFSLSLSISSYLSLPLSLSLSISLSNSLSIHLCLYFIKLYSPSSLSPLLLYSLASLIFLCLVFSFFICFLLSFSLLFFFFSFFFKSYSFILSSLTHKDAIPETCTHLPSTLKSLSLFFSSSLSLHLLVSPSLFTHSTKSFDLILNFPNSYWAAKSDSQMTATSMPGLFIFFLSQYLSRAADISIPPVPRMPQTCIEIFCRPETDCFLVRPCQSAMIWVYCRIRTKRIGDLFIGSIIGSYRQIKLTYRTFFLSVVLRQQNLVQGPL